MDRPLPAYKGDEPYIFVSYAHEESDLVYPQIEWLHRQGFNIWYDEGISPGASWRTELADAIDASSLFLFFATRASIRSINCEREINFAADHGKSLLAVHLTEVSLPSGMDLTLSNQQAILKHELSDNAYHEKLLSGIRDRMPASPERPAVAQVPAGKDDSSKSILIGAGVIALAILAVGVLLTVNRTVEVPAAPPPVTEAQAPIDEKPSIAVLPFVNLSSNAENEYFAAGIHEDVLSNLSKIGELKVISRTSTLRYKNTDKTLRQIGEELDVNHLLEGSVRRSADRVRITVQLIDARDASNLWAESYDRNLTDIFEIQSEVAKEIVKHLQVTLGVASAERLDKAVVIDVDAYDYYLRARVLINDTRLGWDTQKEGSAGTVAIELLSEAIEIQPDFALAYASIAEAYAFSNPNQWTNVSDAALEAADKGMELDPIASEVHLARAFVATRNNQYPIAFGHYSRALELDPNNGRIIWWFGFTLINAGLISQAYELWQNGVELDPLSSEANLARADLARNEGRLDEADALIKKALLLTPDSVTIERMAAFTYARMDNSVEMMRHFYRAHKLDPSDPVPALDIGFFLVNLGDYQSAKMWIDKGVALNEDGAYGTRSNFYTAQGRYDEAKALADEWRQKFPNNRFAISASSNALSGSSRVAYLDERTEESRELLEKSIEELDQFLEPDRVDGKVTVNLGNRYALLSYAYRMKALGFFAEAEVAARQILEFHEQQSAYNAVDGYFFQGLAHALLGNRTEAIGNLQLLESKSAYSGVWVLEAYGLSEDVFGLYDGLSSDIAVVDVIERIKAKNQRDLVRIGEDLPGVLIR